MFFRLDLPFPVPQTNYKDFAPRILSFPELSPMSPRNWPGWGVRPPLLPIVLAWWMPSRGRSFKASHPDVFFQETQCWKEKPPISGNAQVISNLQSLVKQDEQALKIWIWADHWRSGSASPWTSRVFLPGPWQLEVRGEICGAQCWTNLTSHIIRAPSSATWQPRHIRNLFTSLTLTIRITSQEYSGFLGPSEVLIWCMSVISLKFSMHPVYSRVLITRIPRINGAMFLVALVGTSQRDSQLAEKGAFSWLAATSFWCTFSCSPASDVWATDCQISRIYNVGPLSFVCWLVNHVNLSYKLLKDVTSIKNQSELLDLNKSTVLFPDASESLGVQKNTSMILG